MEIYSHCPSCKKLIALTEEPSSGQHVRCPYCECKWTWEFSNETLGKLSSYDDVKRPGFKLGFLFLCTCIAALNWQENYFLSIVTAILLYCAWMLRKFIVERKILPDAFTTEDVWLNVKRLSGSREKHICRFLILLTCCLCSCWFVKSAYEDSRISSAMLEAEWRANGGFTKHISCPDCHYEFGCWVQYAQGSDGQWHCYLPGTLTSSFTHQIRCENCGRYIDIGY